MQRRVIILSLLLWGVRSFASNQRVLNCPMKDCRDCALLIDTKAERAEYMDNESSHYLSKKIKNADKRVFEAPPNQDIPSPGFRLDFDRRSRTADLIEISFKDKSEKIRYKKLKCQFTDKTLTPVQ